MFLGINKRLTALEKRLNPNDPDNPPDNPPDNIPGKVEYIPSVGAEHVIVDPNNIYIHNTANILCPEMIFGNTTVSASFIRGGITRLITDLPKFEGPYYFVSYDLFAYYYSYFKKAINELKKQQ